MSWHTFDSHDVLSILIDVMMYVLTSWRNLNILFMLWWVFVAMMYHPSKHKNVITTLWERFFYMKKRFLITLQKRNSVYTFNVIITLPQKRYHKNVIITLPQNVTIKCSCNVFQTFLLTRGLRLLPPPPSCYAK